MPWFHFKHSYDHRWPSQAVTAFTAPEKTGLKVFVKKEVAEAAKEAGAGNYCDKPKDGDPAHITTPTREESRDPKKVYSVKTGGFSGNPDLTSPRTASAGLPDASDPKAIHNYGAPDVGTALHQDSDSSPFAPAVAGVDPETLAPTDTTELAPVLDPEITDTTGDQPPNREE